MVTQTVVFPMVTGETGSTAKLFSLSSDTPVASGSPQEFTNRKGWYYMNVTDIPAGTYMLIGFGSDNVPLTDSLWADLLLVEGSYPAYPNPGSTTVDAISGDALVYFDDKFETLAGQIISAIGNVVVSSVDLGTTDFPKSLRKGDARSLANGGALTIRVYAASDTEYETPLLGVGSLLFDDATSVKLGFTLAGEESPEVEIDVEWVESGADGYFLLEWNETALDEATTYKRGGTNYHEWGIKVQWPTTTNSRTVVEGVTKILPAIVSNT